MTMISIDAELNKLAEEFKKANDNKMAKNANPKVHKVAHEWAHEDAHAEAVVDAWRAAEEAFKQSYQEAYEDIYATDYVEALAENLTAQVEQQNPKLKKARGALLRAINSGRMAPPPGYEGPQPLK